MLGSFDRSREIVNRCYQSYGLGIFLLPVVLAAMIGLALAQPDISKGIYEAAQAEFAGIHVIGIVFRNGRGQAYLESAGKSELVGVGDKFGSFKVTAIRQDAVELSGIDTTAGGRIPLAGS